jgi:predicted CXXCH cytochrome family protein
MRWLFWACALAACTTQQSHEWLEFFFDGVPPLEGPEEPLGPPPPEVAAHGPTLEERAAMQRERLAVVERSFHPPFRDKRCEQCHTIERSGGWIQGTPELLAPKEQLCQRCHVAPARQFVHGPVATVSCYACHEHHAASQPHLLKQAPQRLCAQCHHGETFVTEKAHAAYGQQSCVACHDPHGSDQPFLLRDAAGKAPATASPASGGSAGV